jgi:hypothetical protein
VTAVVFHPSADREPLESARFHESRGAGLGSGFLREVERILVQIVANPEVGSVFVGTIRRRLVRRFPFAVLYQVEPENVFVIALMRLHRRPGYWKRRLRDNSRTGS